ncbi:MAG: ATP synthase F1 subunit epsilon [Bifidobacteriaceae bacterium]|nr:ATP synthase F1 subunit epsilon [Bifidobacteriaceae bacterium]
MVDSKDIKLTNSNQNNNDKVLSDNHTMSFDFVSPKGRLIKGQCKQVIAPSVDGEIGILYDHEPVLTGMKAGQVRITKKEDVVKVNITGGFLSVDSNEITIVADWAEIVK